MSVQSGKTEPVMSMQSVLEVIQSHSLPRDRFLRRVLQDDPSQEYVVYIPNTVGREAPLFVAALSRNPTEQVKMLSRYCDAQRAIMVAPYFPAEKHCDYQRLGRDGRGARSDLVVNSIIEEVGLLTGVDTTQFYLFGFSGGAQFVHRYTMAHPHRVAAAVVASAGWYTFPDQHLGYPYGIRPSRHLPDTRFDPEEFLRVPIAVIIGENDETDESLRRTKRIDRQQGVTRIERARNWVSAMRETAEAYYLKPLVSFEMLKDSDHSFEVCMRRGGLGEKVFRALFGSPSSH